MAVVHMQTITECFEFGVEGFTETGACFIDFSGAEVPEINTEVEGYNYYIIIYNYDIR